MGILNVTPDSFSDGGHFFSRDAALKQAHQMAAEGADIIDIGGESTRPCAEPASVEEELDRVIPVLEKIRAELPIPISVDTSKAQVMREAIAAGADMINDVMALRGEGSLAAVAASNKVQVCLMHLQGEPRTMQLNPHYDDVVNEIKAFLQARVQVCLEAGIASSRLLIDPGFGFGKTVEHNLQLMKQLQVFIELGYPVLVGVSRKSLIGQVLNKPVTERLYGSLALAVLAVSKGVAVIRTHDVAATVETLKMTHAVLQQTDNL
ncbi:MAG: dihydropteroate synthase [Candidatus Parabeggiatoa sp. nov. 2]|nr:MAG: dihydropteroate synthase [Beggiatoa sp. 4572_84]RKZ57341.1 MAG: dihydropteroate synthase [Gammaproteobacteria bacterium]HEC86073.1 dihydropteroate synthase [Thioploca sp.]